MSYPTYKPADTWSENKLKHKCMEAQCRLDILIKELKIDSSTRMALMGPVFDIYPEWADSVRGEDAFILPLNIMYTRYALALSVLETLSKGKH